jgi:hypothetical protein
MKRFLHSYPIPSNTPRFTLKDGSELILKNAPVDPNAPVRLPPLLRPRKEFPQLTQETKNDIVLKRNTSPSLWTVRRLAKQFNTHESTVMALVQCPQDRWDQLQAEIDEDFASRTPHKKRVIIDRMRRRALW